MSNFYLIIISDININAIIKIEKKHYQPRAYMLEQKREYLCSKQNKVFNNNEFSIKYNLLQDWIDIYQRWPTRKTVIKITSFKKPYMFHVGKWIQNKRYYSSGRNRKGMLLERSVEIKNELMYLNNLQHETKLKYPIKQKI